MIEEKYFTEVEQKRLFPLIKMLISSLRGQISSGDVHAVRNFISRGVTSGNYNRDKHGINPVIRSLRTACLLVKGIAADRDMCIAILTYNLCKEDFASEDTIGNLFGDDVKKLVHGLIKIAQLYKKQAAVEDENFHKLLLTFADDIRVIIIMIVDRLNLMKAISDDTDPKFVHDISSESRYLYAPLAHRLGLYRIKSELEDLSLKYLNRKAYTQIAAKLNETKSQRDQYVDDFIKPIKQALEQAGLKFEIKGRTKSINSIWNKMQKKHVDLNGMYDLFAIRIILDSSYADEKKACWVAYSIVTDIYTANVSRLKDWITIPKSNGYESLHITVQGPENRWVEVQIRTQRMDEIAERGLAAHWKYKGIKSEGAMDVWMNNVREVLEAGSKGRMELIKDMSMNLYDNEVFVFTPKGDLFKLPQGATLLDFAFHVHSKVGCTCVGGKVDGVTKKINYKLKSGDTVEILTSPTQSPRLDWLNFVVTAKARNKIKQAVNESRAKTADVAREMLYRRFKNRKIEIDEATLSKVIKKMGYKLVTDFYLALDNGDFGVNDVINNYEKLTAKPVETTPHEGAENFTLQQQPEDNTLDDSVLVIGENIKGINYKLAKCCNPILGDNIVGFVSSDGIIKIHRADCKNLNYLTNRFPYRLIKAKWSGKIGAQFAVTLRIVGLDDLGIVSSITSVINKNDNTALRNISIEAEGGIFHGVMVLSIDSIANLEGLIKKLYNVRGVKQIERINR